ncbi:emp24/gp25L/p24 family/GOLD-domain-containing protein [Gorgonomyces haynaldii]|nr:emp24/gp25L/p24 family/GOLD-domain-containing protein [Gorgonomyces haynaldii]
MQLWFWTSLVSALHFYADANEEKCFSEDLPANTHIVGGYKLELWDNSVNDFQEHNAGQLQISVYSSVSNHYLLQMKGSNKGKYRFTSTDSGDHQVCFKILTQGWFNTRAKVFLDVQYGEEDESEYENQERSIYSGLTFRIKDLVNRVRTMRQEFQSQRSLEAEYRSASESANTSILRWTILQWVVLGLTCVWQLRQLKTFFVAKKLV